MDVINLGVPHKPTIWLKPVSGLASQMPLSTENLPLSVPVVVGQLASALKQKPFKIIADLMQLGVFATANQCLGFEVVSRIALKYGYVAEKSA